MTTNQQKRKCRKDGPEKSRRLSVYWLQFYNNCLISRTLIGSFLSWIKILIYAAFKFNFQLSNCQIFNQWDFMDFFK